MNNKKHLFNEAERQYIYDFKTVEEIARSLNLNRKTIMSWKEQGDWDRKLMKGISIDMDNGEKVDPGRMYAFCRIIPMFTKVKNYEDIICRKDSKDETKKGISSDLITQIEEEILGIKRDVE